MAVTCLCFVDFKKAFDSVNHWKLLDKLLDDNVNYKLVKLLGFWFSRQFVVFVGEIHCRVILTLPMALDKGECRLPTCFLDTYVSY